VRRAAALAVAVLALAACGDDDDAGRTRLPDVTLDALDPDGTPLALGELGGPAVLNLWATWCAPCREELPAFQEVSESRADVRFVGVDIAEDPATARAFLDELGVTFEQYLDDAGELSEALGVAGLPVTIVLDADGRVATEHIGPMSVDDLEAALADAGA
jgi:thiol-disulfide isomerase/thioredoxin